MGKKKNQIQLSGDYLRDHPVIPGVQKEDFEHFGRSMLALVMHRAESKLGPNSADDVLIDVQFMVEVNMRPMDKPCTKIYAVSEKDLDYNLAEKLVIAHVEN